MSSADIVQAHEQPPAKRPPARSYYRGADRLRWLEWTRRVDAGEDHLEAWKAVVLSPAPMGIAWMRDEADRFGIRPSVFARSLDRFVSRLEKTIAASGSNTIRSIAQAHSVGALKAIVAKAKEGDVPAAKLVLAIAGALPSEPGRTGVAVQVNVGDTSSRLGNIRPA